jgi:Thioredoxin like C-terminal domain
MPRLCRRNSSATTDGGQYVLLKSEKVIQKLLAEAGAGGSRNELVSVDASGAEAAADWNDLKSGENYLGHERTENFASGTAVLDKHRVYSIPSQLRLNEWALSGNWTIGKQAIACGRESSTRSAH